MVINPTYLAQRTRQCTFSLSIELERELTGLNSGQLEGCPAEGDCKLSGMDSLCTAPFPPWLSLPIGSGRNIYMGDCMNMEMQS
jgi:hypothetical protein